MKILMALLLSASSNLDNIVFGMSYGASKVKIPIKSSIIISVISTIITCICMIFGNFLAGIFTTRVTRIISGIIPILLGVYFIITEFVFNKEEKNIGIKMIDLKKICALSCTLSLNNMPIAIAGGIMGTSIMWTIIFSIITSTVFIWLGNVLGRKINSKIISFVASTLLIFMGILEVIII